MRDSRYGEFPCELELQPGDRFRVAVNERTPNTDIIYGDMQKLNGFWLTVTDRELSGDMSMSPHAPHWSHRVKAEPKLTQSLGLKRTPEWYHWEYYHMDKIERVAEQGQRIPIQKKELLPPL